MRDMNVHVIHVTKYSAAIGSRQTNSSSFHPRSVDPSDSISECSVVAIPFAVAIPFGNLDIIYWDLSEWLLHQAGANCIIRLETFSPITREIYV